MLSEVFSVMCENICEYVGRDVKRPSLLGIETIHLKIDPFYQYVLAPRHRIGFRSGVRSARGCQQLVGTIGIDVADIGQILTHIPSGKFPAWYIARKGLSLGIY